MARQRQNVVARRGGRGRPTLSVAMIARNEAPRILRCLESVAGLADEAVVIDTGSTDDTVQLAKQAGARVFHQAWDHHYGRPRDLSLRKCKGDWVLWLDPDETIPEASHAAIRDFLARSAGYDGGSLRNVLGASYRPPERTYPGYGPGWELWKPKLLRRAAGPRWAGRIHEDLVWPREPKVGRVDAIVYNWGTTDESKKEYYTALLVLACREEPDNPTYAMYMAARRTEQRQPDRALELLARFDPESFRDQTQVDKYWITVAQAHKLIAAMAWDQGNTEASESALRRGLACYEKVGTAAAWAEAATMCVEVCQPEEAHNILQQVHESEADNELVAELHRLLENQQHMDPAGLRSRVADYWAQLRQGIAPAQARNVAEFGGGTLCAPPSTEPQRLPNCVVVIPARCPPEEPQRMRNLDACLRALQRAAAVAGYLDGGAQFELIVVEQDEPARLDAPGTGHVLWGLSEDHEAVRHVHIADGGPFNRGRCLNRGAEEAAHLQLEDQLGAPLWLVLADADMLVEPDFFVACAAFLEEQQARGTTPDCVLPFHRAVYLDEDSTYTALDQVLEKGEPPNADAERPLQGESFAAQGGCLWVELEAYRLTGGHDERLEGWGSADRAWWSIMEHHDLAVCRFPGIFWHLHHPRPDETGEHAQRNEQLATQLAAQVAIEKGEEPAAPETPHAGAESTEPPPREPGRASNPAGVGLPAVEPKGPASPNQP